MKAITKTALVSVVLAAAAQASAQVTFFQEQDFQGRSFTTERRIDNFDRFGFNDRASSATVKSERWEICENARYSGRCVVLRPGQYPTLAAMGLNDRISSARAIGRDQRIDAVAVAMQRGRMQGAAAKLVGGGNIGLGFE